jgi:4-amino-4-deoxy-L-arabinose transferase-like glycosyltransferase
VLLGLLPFSFFIPQAFRHSWRERTNTALVFAACVAGVFVLFFSISSTKLPNYTMPCYAFLALLLGAFFTNKMRLGFSQFDIISTVLLTLLGLALPAAAFMGLGVEKALKPYQYLAFGLVPTAVGTLLGLLFYLQKKTSLFLLSTAFSWGILLFILHAFLYPNLTPVLPTTAVEEVLPNNANVVVYKRMDAAFPFHFQQTFEVIHNINETSSLGGSFLLTNHPEGQNLDQLDNIQLLIRQKALFENHTTVLYRIE